MANLGTNNKEIKNSTKTGKVDDDAFKNDKARDYTATWEDHINGRKNVKLILKIIYACKGGKQKSDQSGNNRRTITYCLSCVLHLLL